MPEFTPFPKIPRLSREILITEKIDGTNASIYIGDDGEFLIGSRNRWITPEKNNDNYGFAVWATQNKEELVEKLGPGHHFGEWWGKGIQRNYGMKEKRFSLFNTTRWQGVLNLSEVSLCFSVVPVLATLEEFHTDKILFVMQVLKEQGSKAAPGFMNPEGIVIRHMQSGHLYKKTFESDEKGKGNA